MTLDENVRTTNMLGNVKGGGLGNCFGMTLNWIRASQKNGGVTKGWQIDNGVITQARLVNQWGNQQEMDNVRNAGLTVIDSSSNYASFGSKDCYSVFVIDNPAHAMGAWVNGKTYQFFDPNSGLHRASDFDDLYNGVWGYLHANYPGWTVRTIINIAP